MSLEAMPVTPEEVCSRAMVLCGLDAMTSFNETGRDEIIVASQLYEVIVATCLGAYPWRFATGEQLLELSADDPLDRFENAWVYPTLGANSGRTVQLESVYSGDQPVRFDIVGGLIYANEDDSQELIAHYQYRVEEAYWQPLFALYVINRLAETFAVSVTRNAKQIGAFGQASELWFARAKTRDAQSKSPRRARHMALRRRRTEWPVGTTG